MKYRIKFVYMDGKHIELPLDADKLETLFGRLNDNHIYWADDEQKEGFWLNIDKIRFIQFYSIEEPKKEVKDEEECNRKGEEELPCEDECNSNREKDAE